MYIQHFRTHNNLKAVAGQVNIKKPQLTYTNSVYNVDPASTNFVAFILKMKEEAEKNSMSGKLLS
jgi:hypothetical protein